MSVRAIIIIAGLALALVSSAAMAKGAKVDVCHQQGNGSYHIINVSENAVNAHQGHGDWLVTDEVCGDGIDNDCDGDVDEDCCPCYDRDLLDAYWPNNDPNYAFCWDYSYDNGYYEYDYLRGWGYEYETCDHQGFLWVLAETWTSGGQTYAYCKFDGWFRDFETGEYLTDYYETYTTVDEYDACDATLTEFFEDSELECTEIVGP